MLRGCVRSVVVVAVVVGVGVAVVAGAGCGRVGFDEVSGSGSDARDGVATRCGQIAGELFCESFEGDAKLASVFFTAPGFVVTDASRPFLGGRSLHTRTIGASEASWELGAALPDLVSGDFYVRWYMYVPSGAANLQLASTHVVDAVAPFGGVVVGITGGRLDLSSTEGDAQISNVSIVRDRWQCVQLHVLISQTAGVAETWLDGVAASRLTGVDTLPDISYRNVHAGMFATSLATEPQELWTDELAVGRLPIACD